MSLSRKWCHHYHPHPPPPTLPGQRRSPAVHPRHHSPPPPPSQCAPLCWELLWRGRRGAGAAAVAPHWCLWWRIRSTTPLSWASPRTVNRSWWCAWLGPATTLTCIQRVTAMCWSSFTGGGTSTELHRVLRCDCSLTNMYHYSRLFVEGLKFK